MTTNYQQLAAENVRRYGEETEHLAFLGELYADRGHFLLELLQNAEDARASAVELRLTADALEVRHDGRPFTEGDVRGICSVGRSTKSVDSGKIGRFGIGFKSVYAYAASPEIHCGDEHFAIEHYVRPAAIPPAWPGANWTTLIRLPFDAKRVTPETARGEIAKAASRLAATTLLFLRHIERVCLLDGSEVIAELTRRPGAASDEPCRLVELSKLAVEPEQWAVFRRDVPIGPNQTAGAVELAFRLSHFDEEGILYIIPHNAATLAAYFPTDIRIHAGFILQAPFHTTPARDNLKTDDPHNSYLVQQGSELLIEVLRWLQQRSWLDADILRCLPLREADFPEGTLLAPLFNDVAAALTEEDLLPRRSDGEGPYEYVAGEQAAWPECEALAELLTQNELAEVLDRESTAEWLHSSLNIGDNSDLSRYLREHIEVPTVGLAKYLEWLATKPTTWWAERESDWLLQLYAYLASSDKQLAAFRKLPLVRMADGSHRSPAEGALFLPAADPGEKEALAPFLGNLSIVEAEIAGIAEAFLRKVGVRPLTAVGFVEGVIKPRYKHESSVTTEECVAHLDYIRHALKRATSEDASRVRDIVAGLPIVLSPKRDGQGWWRLKPVQVYLGHEFTGSTDLELYFSASPDTYFAAPLYLNAEARQDEWREFLTSIGCHLLPRKLESKAGNSRNDTFTDFDASTSAVKSIAAGRSVDPVSTAVAVFRVLSAAVASSFSGNDDFTFAANTRYASPKLGPRGGYQGVEYTDAPWIATLRDTAWLPDMSATLRRPSELVTDTEQNRKLLGSTGSFLHERIALNPDSNLLALRLGIRRQPDVKQVVARLADQASASAPMSIEEASEIYRFLDEKRGYSRDDFTRRALILCGENPVIWRTATQTFWKDHGRLFGSDRACISKIYPPRLRDFFLRVGVREDPDLDECLRYLTQKAGAAELTDTLFEQVTRLIRHIAKLDETERDDDEEETPFERWAKYHDLPMWPARRGESLIWSRRSDLTIADNEHLQEVFRGKVATWPYSDETLARFGRERLHLPSLSSATRALAATAQSPQPHPTLASRLASVWPYICAFMDSPTWRPHLDDNWSRFGARPPEVYCTARLRLRYTLGTVEADDPEDAEAYFEPHRNRVWLSVDSSDLEECAECIGDELAHAFGPSHLGDFIRNALTSSPEKLLKKWRKKGLIWRVLSESSANASSNENADDGDGSDTEPELEAATEEVEEIADLEAGTPALTNRVGGSSSSSGPPAASPRAETATQSGSVRRELTVSTGPAPSSPSKSTLEQAFNRPGEETIRHPAGSPQRVTAPSVARFVTQSAITAERSAEPSREFRQTPRVINVWDSKNAQVRNFLLQEYAGECQICGLTNSFPRRSDGRPYFEGVYLIPHVEAKWTDRPGNVLSLCAQCSAKWQHGSVSTSDLTNQINALWKGLKGSESRQIASRLVGKQVAIRFTHAHAIELQELGAALRATPAQPSAAGSPLPHVHSSPPGRTQPLVICPNCKCQVRADRLQEHVASVHGQKGSTGEPRMRRTAPVVLRTRICFGCSVPFQAEPGVVRCPKCR